MTQAAGMYNTLLESDDPALVIESLNGYRLKEKLPENIGDFNVPIGISEVLLEGNDITIVTYGSMVRIVLEAAKQLKQAGISIEVIDAQCLIPFDLSDQIIQSVEKTNKIIFADEDVPSGGTGYMLSECMDKDGFWDHLDTKPKCISAKAHRPAYGSDGDYFSKPNIEDIFDACYQMMNEYDPSKYPENY